MGALKKYDSQGKKKCEKATGMSNLRSLALCDMCDVLVQLGRGTVSGWGSSVSLSCEVDTVYSFPILLGVLFALSFSFPSVSHCHPHTRYDTHSPPLYSSILLPSPPYFPASGPSMVETPLSRLSTRCSDGR